MSSPLARQLSLELREIIRPVTTVMSLHSCPYGYRRSQQRLLENGCQNVHVCPVCARKIQARSREAFVVDAKRIESEGFSPWHITLTLSYGDMHPSNRYRFLLGDVWTKFRKTRLFKTIVESPACAGYVRIVEETISLSGQLNPHIHLVLFCKDQESELQQLPDAWRVVVANYPGHHAISAVQSVGLVYDVSGLSWYLFKHMYIDLRKEPPFPWDHLSPVECLRMFHLTRGQDWLALWFIFETSSCGVKRLVTRLKDVS